MLSNSLNKIFPSFHPYMLMVLGHVIVIRLKLPSLKVYYFTFSALYRKENFGGDNIETKTVLHPLHICAMADLIGPEFI